MCASVMFTSDCCNLCGIRNWKGVYVSKGGHTSNLINSDQSNWMSAEFSTELIPSLRLGFTLDFNTQAYCVSKIWKIFRQYLWALSDIILFCKHSVSKNMWKVKAKCMSAMPQWRAQNMKPSQLKQKCLNVSLVFVFTVICYQHYTEDADYGDHGKLCYYHSVTLRGLVFRPNQWCWSK